LNLNKSKPAPPVLASESTEDATVRQLQGLVQNQLAKRRVQYPKEFKLGVIRDANAKGVSKYAIAKRLPISEKMLWEWIAK